jgi:integrase/recombinase XerD
MAATITKVYRKDKMNDRGVAPVYIRLTKNRKTSYIATNLRLEAKYWDDVQKKVKSSYPNSAQANTYLNGLMFQVEAEALQEQTTNRQASVKAIKEKFTGDKSTSFFEVAQGLLGRYKSSKKISTHDTFKATVNKVREFAKSDKLTLQEIDIKFLGRFEQYLRNDLKNKPNTVHKDLKIMRRIFNTAYKLGLTEHNLNPFHRYELKTEKTVREHLTEEELMLLEALDLVPGSRLDLHRDMFLFSCNAGGLRVSDVLLLGWHNFDGTHLHITIRKTGVQHSLKLPNTALAIIRKYMPGGENREGFIFPMLPHDLDLNDFVEVDRRISGSTAFINKNLKTLAKLAGINKNLHFHISRHTWACLALKKGLGIELVARLMALYSVREAQVYAKLVSRELDAAMDRFNS